MINQSQFLSHLVREVHVYPNQKMKGYMCTPIQGSALSKSKPLSHKKDIIKTVKVISTKNGKMVDLRDAIKPTPMCVV